MAYIGSSPTKVVSRQSANIFTYTATANQTAFTGSDANGNTLACTPSDIMVHMNGIKLEESDFTASTTTVTLGSGAAAGDEVTITAFVTFETADAYTKSASDIRYVNASGDTMSGDLTIDTKLGIGTVSPNYQLDLQGGATTNDRLRLLRGTDDTNQFMTLGYNHISTHRANVALASAQTGLSFKQVGSDGTRTAMAYDSAGRVTMPNQPSILASSSAIQTFSSAASATTMVLGTTNFSRGNLTRSGNNLTVPVTGYYVFHYAIQANIYNSIRAFGVRLYKNGSNSQSHEYHSAHYLGGASATHDMFTGTFLISLAANDYVSLVGVVYDTHNNVNFYTQINGYLLG